jgi:hypothetical protein
VDFGFEQMNLHEPMIIAHREMTST